MKARSAIAAGALALGALGVAAPAYAITDPAPTCWTTHSTLGSPAGRDDSGFIGGTWAKDTFVRTTTICPLVLSESKVAIAAEVFGYSATVSDTGTFVATQNPATGAAITTTHGTFHGGYTENFTSTQGNWEPDQHSYGDGSTFSGNDPATTGNWVKFVFGTDDYHSDGLNQDWSWTYVTCGGVEGSEKWIDAASNNAGDPASGAGEITGKKCPCPPSPSTSPAGSPSATPSSSPSGSPSSTPTTTPTSSPSSSPSSSASPSPSTTSTSTPPPAGGTIGGGGNLPTTGTKTLIIGAGGALLVLIGGAFWALSRKRNEYEDLNGDTDDGGDSTQVLPQV
jgi:LPXTG-motif cell wall-anchored protein